MHPSHSMPSFRRFPTLHAFFRRVQRFVQAAQGLLATDEVCLRKERVRGAINLQVRRLIAAAHAALFLVPCVFAFG